jgi:phospholipase C
MGLTGGKPVDIQHVVVLMLENRSFDSMLGTLYPKSPGFDGLSGAERNIWHKPDGTEVPFQVWKSPDVTPQSACIPTPDPGESFTDIHVQLYGLTPGEAMSGFVDNYMRQPAAEAAYDPKAPMHYYVSDELPVMSLLAREFGVSDRWFAPAPCQTWPNRFFAHTGTANGYVNNTMPPAATCRRTVLSSRVTSPIPSLGKCPTTSIRRTTCRTASH